MRTPATKWAELIPAYPRWRNGKVSFFTPRSDEEGSGSAHILAYHEFLLARLRRRNSWISDFITLQMANEETSEAKLIKSSEGADFGFPCRLFVDAPDLDLARH